MRIVFEQAFWFCFAACAWTYGGYLVWLVLSEAWRGLRRDAAWLRGGPDRRTPVATRPLPSVSVLIAAYDEEAVLARKLENTLALDYPADKLEIWVGSDGSSDATESIARAFEGRGVKLSAAPRAGKAMVLNRLASMANGEILLFTDANTQLGRDALRRLVARLDDPRAGAICGRLILRSPDGRDAEEGLYWRFENLLKLYEGRRGTLLGANGGLYILRREYWRTLDPSTVVDDFVVAMRVLLAGGRVAYAPDAVATEETAGDLAGEWRRRVRIAAGNFRALRELRPLLVRPDFASFAFWSHKVLRWMAPALLLVMLASSLALASTPFWIAVAALQASFYLAALGARLPLPRAAVKVASLSRYFVGMNAAMLAGLVRHLQGTQRATWRRTERAAGRAA